MKKLAKIALILPITLLMLHSLIQHEHEIFKGEEAYFVSCEHHISIFGVLQHAFELDERQNHLEEFKLANGYSFEFQAADIPNLIIIPVVDQPYVKLNPRPFFQASSNYCYTSTLSHRGPPSFS